MAVSNASGMALDPDQLNSTDETLLDLLHEGRVTAALAREFVRARGLRDDVPDRSYYSQRLIRLAEHNHATNLHGTGVYELVGDPRDTSQKEDSSENQQ